MKVDYIYIPNGKPRLLIKALLTITMDTEEATERNRAPTTQSCKPDISPIYFLHRIMLINQQRIIIRNFLYKLQNNIYLRDR